jgi:aspartate racemase
MKKMNKFRCLGLVGGLGVGATIHYYKTLAKAYETEGRVLDVVIANAQTSRVLEYVQAGDREGLAEYLNGFIQRLEAAGADVAAIPAVTPHYCVKELLATSALPIFNIFEPLNHELKARAVRRVAIFGGRFVVESALFGQVSDVEIISPRPDEVDYIQNIYGELLQKGEGSEAQYAGLTALAHALCTREGVDAIILAGTDLSLLFNAANTHFPNIDCAELHLQAILAGLRGEAR